MKFLLLLILLLAGLCIAQHSEIDASTLRKMRRGRVQRTVRTSGNSTIAKYNYHQVDKNKSPPTVAVQTMNDDEEGPNKTCQGGNCTADSYDI